MLTDEQAFYIRACEEFDILVRANTQAKWRELEDLGFVQDNPGDSKPNNWRLPTDAGRAALVEYRAAHVTVPRKELVEVTDWVCSCVSASPEEELHCPQDVEDANRVLWESEQDRGEG